LVKKCQKYEAKGFKKGQNLHIWSQNSQTGNIAIKSKICQTVILSLLWENWSPSRLQALNVFIIGTGWSTGLLCEH